MEVTERVRPLGIEVRAGVHTGECEVIDEQVRRPHGLDRGARGVQRRSLGGAGLPDREGPRRRLGLAFEDAGEHELKGVPTDGTSTGWSQDDHHPERPLHQERRVHARLPGRTGQVRSDLDLPSVRYAATSSGTGSCRSTRASWSNSPPSRGSSSPIGAGWVVPTGSRPASAPTLEELVDDLLGRDGDTRTASPAMILAGDRKPPSSRCWPRRRIPDRFESLILWGASPELALVR